MYALSLGENSSEGFHFFFRLVRSYSRIAVESLAVCLGMSTFAHRRRTKSIVIVSKAMVTIIILKELTLQCNVEENLLKGYCLAKIIAKFDFACLISTLYRQMPLNIQLNWMKRFYRSKQRQ